MFFVSSVLLKSVLKIVFFLSLTVALSSHELMLFLLTSTIGLAGDKSSASSLSLTIQYFLSCSIFSNITAKAFSSLCFSRLSAATASSSKGLQARWYPPISLIAKIPPFFKVSTAFSSASSLLFCGLFSVISPAVTLSELLLVNFL